MCLEHKKIKGTVQQAPDNMDASLATKNEALDNSKLALNEVNQVVGENKWKCSEEIIKVKLWVFEKIWKNLDSVINFLSRK